MRELLIALVILVPWSLFAVLITAIVYQRLYDKDEE